MKKTLTLALTALFASAALSAGATTNSDLLNIEETDGTQFINALETKNFSEASKHMGPDLAKQLDKSTFDNLVQDMEKTYGKLTNIKLAELQKGDTADRITFLADSEKGQIVFIGFMMSTQGQPQIINFVEGVVEPPKADQKSST